MIRGSHFIDHHDHLECMVFFLLMFKARSLVFTYTGSLLGMNSQHNKIQEALGVQQQSELPGVGGSLVFKDMGTKFGRLFLREFSC